jgi:hypothetical protein
MIREPSSGGIGRRLNSARVMFKVRLISRKRPQMPAAPELSAPLRTRSTSRKALSIARMTFTTGPAMPTIAAPKRALRSLFGANGTGLPQPNPTMTSMKVPTGSRWDLGLRVSRPASLAVGSP